MLYSAEQTQHLSEHSFAYLKVSEADHCLTLTLNRPQKKNALTPGMLRELCFGLSYAHHHNHIWWVVLAAEGDVFCSGADMKAFMGKAENTDSSIPKESAEIILGDLFRKVHKPMVLRLHAPVYAGGFLLVAGAHYVLASEGVTLALPEVKRGLWPMQVMASLLQVMPPRQVLDLCMRARKLDAQEARRLGLITHLVPSTELDDAIRQLGAEICKGSPAAIRLGLKAFDEMQALSAEQHHPFLRKMLAENLQTADAREGIMALD
jgi:enoyl-CoA hydratase/carnithine racemase